MYKNRYVTELSISEVKEYYEILRRNRKLTHEEIEDFGICKERLIEYAYKNIDVLDKIRAEIIELRSKQNIGVLECLDIIDKYKSECTNNNRGGKS